MKFLSLALLALSFNTFAATDCDRVLDQLMELGASKGGSEALIEQYEARLKGFEAYQKSFDQYPNIQTLGAYDRESLKAEVKESKAAIKRLELNIYGILQIAPRVKATAKERCR